MCWRILLQRNAQATLTFRSMARDTAPFMAFPVPPTQKDEDMGYFDKSFGYVPTGAPFWTKWIGGKTLQIQS